MVMPELVLLILAIGGFIFAYTVFPFFRMAIYFIAVLVLGWLFVKLFIKKYDEYERAIIFRMGKFHRIGGPGWTIVLPFIEREYSKVDVRTKMVNLEIPVAFTGDDLRLKISGVVYYKIVAPNKAILKIDNYMTGLLNLLTSETRNLISTLTMRDLFSGLDRLNDMLADRIRHATWKWGIDVPMVQLRSIMPPEEIAVAMQEKEVSAQMLQAQKFKAEAKKVAIEALGEAAQKLDDRAIMYLYVKALEEMSKSSNTKVVFPAQFMDPMKGGFGLGTGMAASGAGGIGALGGMDTNSAVDAVKNRIMNP